MLILNSKGQKALKLALSCGQTVCDETKICKSCDKEFSRGDLEEKYWFRKKYCSPKCANHGPAVEVICVECKTLFSKRKRSKTKFCSKTCANKATAREKPKQKLEYEKSLEFLFPEVADHWDEKRNGFPAKEISAGSTKSYWFSCGRKYHDHFTSVYNKRNAKEICPYCSGRYPTPDNNLSTKYPHLAEEWHPSKNDKKPTEVTYGSAYNAWWQCSNGHEWQISVNSRTNMNTSCGTCSNQSSRNEIRLLTELMFLFDKVVSRDRSLGVEADILLPDAGVAVEFDGSHWHKDRVDKDIRKNEIFQKHGVKVIRFREEPLSKISDHDITVERNALITKKDLNALLEIIGISDTKIRSYLPEKEFQNGEMYQTYLEYFPSPFPEHSLAMVAPNIAKDWHPTKNAPLTPNNFTHQSGYIAWWYCENGHAWDQSIHARVGRDIGCPFCSGRLATKDDNLMTNHPIIAEFWHPTKNQELTPDNIKSRSGVKVWWRCTHDTSHEWRERPFNLTQLDKNFCLQCINDFCRHLNKLKKDGYSGGILAEYFKMDVSAINGFAKNYERKKRPNTTVEIPAPPWGIPDAKHKDMSHTPASAKSVSSSIGTFPSISHAAKAVGLSNGVVSYRLRTGWNVEQALGLEPPPEQKFQGTVIVVDGVEYPSISAAARVHGGDPSWIGKQIRNGVPPDIAFKVRPAN